MVTEPDRPEVEIGSPRAVGFLLRESKLHPPQLQPDILKRDRLLDWLAVKINRRAVFVVAEAGFGKTTLLADFVRRSHVRSIWYRLDEEEADGLIFLRYFVAACRAVDPRLFPRCAALLADSMAPPVGWQPILTTLLAELPRLGDEATAVILDDYHLAEHVPAIREITEQLISRAPDRLSFVFASRRTPKLPVARLRARDELAELTREELCFETGETEELFRETYQQPLEPDVLRDLQARTEGWPASLQLVKQALKRRTPAEIRSFVGTLNGAEGVLYDFLAEEVVADLPDDLRTFLLRASLLEDVEADLAGPAMGFSVADAARLIEAAETIGLLSRVRVSTRPARFHPLVRDFLFSSLRHEVGDEAIVALHRQIARAEEPRSWRRAAHHYAEAGDASDVRRVIEASTHIILGSGEYESAEAFMTRLDFSDPSPYLDIIRCRIAFGRGQVEAGRALAERASVVAAHVADKRLMQLDALNRIYVRHLSTFDLSIAGPAVEAMARCDLDEEGVAIANAMAGIYATAADGRIEDAARLVSVVLRVSRALRHSRHEAIALVNLAVLARESGQIERSQDLASDALTILETSGAPDEIAFAHLRLAYAAAHLGRMSEASEHLSRAMSLAPSPEAAISAAEIHALYGDPSDALRYLEQFDAAPIDMLRSLATLIRARLGHPEVQSAYQALTAAAMNQPVFWVGYQTLVSVTGAYLAVRSGLVDAKALAVEAVRRAADQGALYHSRTATLIQAAVIGHESLSSAVASAGLADWGYLSIVSELIIIRYDELSAPAVAAVDHAAELHPTRWRSAARALLESEENDRRLLNAGRVLERVGEADDIQILRDLARRPGIGAPTLGVALIRRTAPTVHVDDLGPVTVAVGPRLVSNSEIRRKVLALLCFLLTRQRMSATCEEVLDAIWPGLDQQVGMNSLNQTVYFLRRVIEPKFNESTTPGYVRHEGEIVSLDATLVHSQSTRCIELLRRISISPSDRSLVIDLQREYAGRFALDFIYEEWASGYRDHLHAAYLAAVERAIADDTNQGEFDRAISIAQRAVQVDPDADQIEVTLLRLYKLTGACSAAAEQYEHYAGVMRDQLGVEPPPLEAL